MVETRKAANAAVGANEISQQVLLTQRDAIDVRPDTDLHKELVGDSFTIKPIMLIKISGSSPASQVTVRGQAYSVPKASISVHEIKKLHEPMLLINPDNPRIPPAIMSNGSELAVPFKNTRCSISEFDDPTRKVVIVMRI
ncbi:MAG: hypothetical protein RLP02_11175, partial [Coleofasciculus sp. C2-GNP5-27]